MNTRVGMPYPLCGAMYEAGSNELGSGLHALSREIYRHPKYSQGLVVE